MFSENDSSEYLFPPLISDNNVYMSCVENDTVISPLELAIKNIDKNLIIVGNGGVGKSFSLYLLWKKSLIYKNKKIIYIPLNEYNKWKQKEFLPVKICKVYFENNREKYDKFFNNEITDSNKEIVIVLDGFNEIIRNEKEIILNEIKEFAQNRNVKVIITSRYDIRNYYGFTNFNILQVDELKDHQIDMYFKEKEMDIKKISPNLRKVFRIPMMLLLYSETVEIVERDKNIKWLDFIIRSDEMKEIEYSFGEIIWNYLEANVAKIFFDTKNIKESIIRKIVLFFYMPKLCWHLFLTKKTEFTRKEFNKIIAKDDIKAIMTRFEKPFDMVDNERKIINQLSNSYIFRIITNEIDIVSEKGKENIGHLEEDIYIIKHDYYRDFFVATYIINEIYTCDTIPDVLVNYRFPLLISELIGDILGEHHNTPVLKNNCWTIEHFRKTLLHDVMKKLSLNNDAQQGYVLKNILDIWVKARNGYIINEKFNNIDMTNCNLSNIVFSVKDKNNWYCSEFFRIRNKLEIKDFLYEGHMGVVNSLDFNGGYEILASAASDGIIKIWKLTDSGLDLCNTLKGHEKSVTCVKFCANSDELFSGSIDGTIRLWDIWNGTNRIIYKGDECIKYIDIKNDGKKIVFCTTLSAIFEYNLYEDKLEMYSGHKKSVNMVTYIPSGIISCDQDGNVFEWNTSTKNIEYEYGPSNTSVNCAIYSAVNDVIITASDNGEITIWKKRGERLKTYQENENSQSILFISLNRQENKLISCGKNRTIHEWSISNNKLKKLSTIEGHGGSVNCAIYDNEANRIYSGSWDNSIGIWEALIGISIKKILGTRFWITHIELNKNEDKMLVSCWNGDIQEWDLINIKCIRIFRGHDNVVNKAIYNHDETRILSCSYDRTIKEWNIENTQCCRTLVGHTDCVTDIQYINDGRKIISSSFDGQVIEWTLHCEDSYDYNVIHNHSDYVNGVMYYQNGKSILSWADNGVILEYDMDKGCKREYDISVNTQFEEKDIKYATYKDSKEILFVTWDGTIGLYNKISEIAKIIYSLNIHGLQIQDANYYEKGNYIILLGSDNNFYKISFDSKEREMFIGHENLVSNVIVAKNENLYSSSWDGSIFLWKKGENIGKKLFSVIMGLYINGCYFRECMFESNDAEKTIKRYSA